jgi:hypothetical protein
LAARADDILRFMQEKVTVVASFRDENAADEAVRRFADPDSLATAAPYSAISHSTREGGFMARVVLIVVAWSIIGTAIGAGTGAFLSYLVGPHGTDGLILQMVSWAIFMHLLIGLWAGYLLLADRSGRELGEPETTIVLQAERGEASALARALQEAGASRVVIQAPTTTGR